MDQIEHLFLSPPEFWISVLVQQVQKHDPLVSFVSAEKFWEVPSYQRHLDCNMPCSVPR